MNKLSEEQLREALQLLPEWKLEDGTIVREWKLADFVAAVAFVNRVAEVAEARGHHPDIDVRYNRVKLGLVTHDAGGITAHDTAMCAELDRSL